MPVKTSPAKSSNNRGFTLIEILVVLMIMGAIVAFAIPRLEGRENRLKSLFRKLTVLSKSVHNAARLSGRTYRIVFLMRPDGKTHQIWIEGSTRSGAIIEAAMTEKEKSERKAETSDTSFTVDTKILKAPIDLPKGLIIESVEVGEDREYKTGKAYVHYLPQGFADEAAIHIGAPPDKKWTLHTKPLTGESEIITEDLKLRELRGP